METNGTSDTSGASDTSGTSLTSGPTVEYRLPLSSVSFTGTRTERGDTVLGRTEVDRVGVAELKVVGDPEALRAVQLGAGFGKTFKATFKLTPDGRLVSTDVTVTGVGGTILTGVVGAVASLGGLALKLGVMAAFDGSATPANATNDLVAIEKAYVEHDGAAASIRTNVKAASAKLEARHRNSVIAFSNATTVVAKRKVLREIAGIEVAQAAIRLDVGRAEALFETWRQSTITTTVRAITDEITLDELQMADAFLDEKKELGFPADGPPKKVTAAREKVKAAWDDLGCLVLIEGDPFEKTPDDQDPRADEKSVVFRFPRSVTLHFHKRVGNSAVLDRSMPAMVVDRRSRWDAIKVDSGFFSENRGAITFNADGIPTGFDFGQGSEAAGLASAIGGVPGTVATSLENVKKISDQATGLRAAGLASELARVKSEVELKQQGILLDGLNATPQAYADLERLKLEADTYEKRKTLGEFDSPPDPIAGQIADLTQQMQLLRLQAQLARVAD